MAPYFFAPEDGAKYVLQAPDGTRCVFNDDVDPDSCGLNSSATGLDSPDVTVSSDLLVEADGGYNGIYFYGMRPITLNGQCYKFTDVPSRNLQLAKITGASNAMASDGSLTFAPSWRATNNVANPNFEYGVAPWSYSAATGVPTISQSSAWAAQGTKSGRWQFTTTGAAPAVFAAHLAVPVVGGATYTFGASQNVASFAAGAGLQVAFNWRDKGGVFISQTLLSAVGATGVKTWAQAGLVAPQGAFSVDLFLGVVDVAAHGATDFSIDKVFLSRESATYLDGDGVGNFWGGTKGNSISGNYVSMYTPVRRQQPTRISGPWVKNFQIQLVSQYAPLFSTAQVVVPAAASISAENYGNYPAYPVLRVFGAGSAATFVVTNTLTGQSIEVNGPASIAGGAYVDIDVLNHTATHSSGTSWNRYINFATTTWPTVTPQAVSTWTVSASLTMQATYRHSWV